MAVRRGDLRAMAVVVHPAQRVQEAPDAGAEEGTHRAAERPEHRRLVRVVAAAAPDHGEGEDHHGEEGRDLQRREDIAHPLPIARRADPVVVVPGAEQAGEEREADDAIKPLLHHLAVDAGHLDDQEGEDGGHHQLPDALHPKVDDVPPIELVDGDVAGIPDGEQPEHRDADHAEHQHVGDRGAAAAQDGGADVEEEDQRDDDDRPLDPERLLEDSRPPWMPMR